MNPQMRGQVGKTSLTIPALGLGGSELGGLRTDRTISDAHATATYRAAWACDVRYFDTAPMYGDGLGERRLGQLLQGQPRDSFFISTKVGKFGWPGQQFDYRFDATLESIDKSLERLGTSRLDGVFIHDIDPYSHGPDDWKLRFEEAMTGAYPALCRLKSEGIIRAVGVGVNSCEVCIECMRAGDFDVFMLAGKYTLLNQSALHELLPLCEQNGVSIIAAAPFNSGILASGGHPKARYDEAPANAEVLRKVLEIEAICDEFGVSLGAAALQLPIGHPSIAAVVPGPRSAEQIRCVCRWFEEPIPPEFWTAMKQAQLLAEHVPTPEQH